MKRFFCTICGHVKRVTQLPLNVRSQDAHLPINRIGQCERHSAGRVHPSRVGPLPKVMYIKKSDGQTPVAQAVNKSAQRAQHKQSSKGAK